MPAFVCRWPNGDFSLVQAQSKDEATTMLDEFSNADGCPLFAVPRLMIHFKLTDDGNLVLNYTGGDCAERFWGKTYPLLYEALCAESRDEDCVTAMRKAVQEERKRVPNPPSSDDPLDLPVALREQILENLRVGNERKSKKKSVRIR